MGLLESMFVASTVPVRQLLLYVLSTDWIGGKLVICMGSLLARQLLCTVHTVCMSNYNTSILM